MKKIKKIILSGCMGAGKSTFAIKLHKKTGYELIHVDLLMFINKYDLKPDEQGIKLLNEVFNKEYYILDGFAIGNFNIINDTADLHIIFDFPYLTCLKRALIRNYMFPNNDLVGQHMSIGNHKKRKIDFRVIKWVYTSKINTKKYIRMKMDNMIILKNDKQVKEFLDNFSELK